MNQEWLTCGHGGDVVEHKFSGPSDIVQQIAVAKQRRPPGDCSGLELHWGLGGSHGDGRAAADHERPTPGDERPTPDHGPPTPGDERPTLNTGGEPALLTEAAVGRGAADWPRRARTRPFLPTSRTVAAASCPITRNTAEQEQWRPFAITDRRQGRASTSLRRDRSTLVGLVNDG